MTRIIISSVLIITFFACNNPDSGKDQTTIAPTDSIPAISPGNLSGCYTMVIEKDTAYMTLDAAGYAVSGTLEYKRFEKDGNKGSFTGKIVPGSKMIVWYNFHSEGFITVRQSIFKITEKGLVEGYGDIAMQHDTVAFKYPQALTYEEKHPFIKTPCIP